VAQYTWTGCERYLSFLFGGVYAFNMSVGFTLALRHRAADEWLVEHAYCTLKPAMICKI
jgi:hypothetical protein